MGSQDNQHGSGLDHLHTPLGAAGTLPPVPEQLAESARGSSAVLRTAIDRLAALLWKPGATPRSQEPASSSAASAGAATPAVNGIEPILRRGGVFQRCSHHRAAYCFGVQNRELVFGNSADSAIGERRKAKSSAVRPHRGRVYGADPQRVDEKPGEILTVLRSRAGKTGGEIGVGGCGRGAAAKKSGSQKPEP